VTARARRALAASLWAVAAGVAAVSLALSPEHRGLGDVLVAVSFQVFTTMGALLLVRRPGHPIGPLFLLTGLCAAMQGLAEAVVAQAQHRHDLSGSVVHLAAWADSWLWLPTLVVPLVFVPLLFPDGKPASRRWRAVVIAGVVGAVLAPGSLALAAITIPTRALVSGNTQVTGWKHIALPIAAGSAITCFVCALLGLVSMVLRYRRGDATTRQQSKIVLFAVVLAITAVVLGSVVPDKQNFLEPFGTALIAVGVSVAVLRYRLFDIDKLISRTLSYALVTGLLVATYAGGVALLTRLGPFSSSVGVAATTLFVAAVFTPVRRRVQGAIDHRFNRARYDAARTIDAFAVRLRDEVDPDVVRSDLLDVTAGSVQPASISLWTAS
jgi:hypothetical protein